MIRNTLALASAAALVISPTVAQASAPLPAQTAAVERAGAESGDSALVGEDGSFIAKGLFPDRDTWNSDGLRRHFR